MQYKLIFFIALIFSLHYPNFTSAQEFSADKKGTRTIYLVRHGQYDHNDQRDPDIGKELVPLGITQSRLVANRLRNFQVTMSSIISSTMTRARQTAMIINEEFPHIELQLSELIRECTMPTWRNDIVEEENPVDLIECTTKLDSAFSIFFTPSPDEYDKNDIIVCHGNVIRYYVTKVLKVESLSWLQMTVSNCGLTVIKIRPDGSMKLFSFNDVGHIPPNLQTSTSGKNKQKALIPPGD
ncbi:MAG: histidine phosphatase family protein [Ignavibacteria bacterium]|jgi:serine/threonine-protein phosphatase PGAM5